jgi:hypothetical protein
MSSGAGAGAGAGAATAGVTCELCERNKWGSRITPASIRHEFGRLELDHLINEDDLFVFSAQTLYYLDHPGHKIGTPSHRAEITRFLDRLGHYVKDRGLRVVILDSMRATWEVRARGWSSFGGLSPLLCMPRLVR